MKVRRIVMLAFSIIPCLAMLIAFTLVGNAGGDETTVRYVAVSGTDTGDCANAETPCCTVQYAVDAASDNDTIKVAAGTYTDIHPRPAPPAYDGPSVITQVVYLSKTLTIRGGYTATNGFTEPSDSNANRTVLDAQWQGRVLFITGAISPSVERLQMVNGNAYGLGGYAGGTAIGGGVCIQTAAVTISDCAVIDSVATRGGGISVEDSASTVVGSTVADNWASDEGGGIYMNSGAIWPRQQTRLQKNRVTGNGAQGSGGGLYLIYSDASFENNLIADNQAHETGSGLYIRSSTAHLLHTTIARNWRGEGSAMYVSGDWIGGYSSVYLTNTMMVSHTVGVSGNVGTDNTVRLEATLWGTDTWANWSDWCSGCSPTTGTINLWELPGFVAADLGDYHISLHSAAMDSGVNAGVVQDIDGQSRPAGSGYDIGADECWFFAGVYLPLILRNAP